MKGRVPVAPAWRRMRAVGNVPVGSVVREPGLMTLWHVVGRLGSMVVLDGVEGRLLLSSNAQVLTISQPDPTPPEDRVLGGDSPQMLPGGGS